MTDHEIFDILEQNIGISGDDVIDYRPCNSFYEAYGIPTITDAIMVQLRGNGSLIYIPDKDKDGNEIKREFHKEDIQAKVVFQDGVLEGAFMSKDAKAAGLKLDIVDADSEVDLEAAVRNELSNHHMEAVNISVRNPELPMN